MNKEVKSSAQRLTDLENQLEALTQSMDGFLEALKTTLIKVANVEVTAEYALKKVSDEVAALKGVLIDANPNLDSTLKERMVQNKVNELVKSLQDLKDNGVVQESETGEVTEKSFLVLQEENKDGELISARTQIIVASLEQGMKDMLLGKKLGDKVDLGETRSTVTIQEVYEVVA